jgi:acyl dehydratase
LIPIDKRYFEDYVPGSVHEYGTIIVDAAEVIDFARKFDPQYMHVDVAAATQGPFGGLIASGWHTAAMTMRLLVDNYLSSVASLASPGIEELRWVRPVRPGDALRVRVTVTSAVRSRSKSDRGVVSSLIEVINQSNETVASIRALNLMKVRPS